MAKATKTTRETAMKAAFDESNKGKELDVAVDDAGAEQELNSDLPEASKESPILVFENGESIRYGLAQACNSIQYFGTNNLAWVAGVGLLSYGEDLTEAHVIEASKLVTDIDAYFTDGSDTETHEGGVDGVAGKDFEGHVDLNDLSQMDGGTDKRKRVSVKQMDIIRNNAERYLTAAATLKRMGDYDIKPTQPFADFKGNNGEMQAGTLTRVITAFNDKAKARRAEAEAKKQGNVVEFDKASEEMAESTLSLFGA